jgi:hypothetical protein
VWPAARPLPPRPARSLRCRGEKQKDQRTGQTAEHRRGGAWAGKGENPIAGVKKRALACARRGSPRDRKAVRSRTGGAHLVWQPRHLSLPGPLCGGMLAEPREMSCMAGNDAARRGCASAKTERQKSKDWRAKLGLRAYATPLSSRAVKSSLASSHPPVPSPFVSCFDLRLTLAVHDEIGGACPAVLCQKMRPKPQGYSTLMPPTSARSVTSVQARSNLH